MNSTLRVTAFGGCLLVLLQADQRDAPPDSVVDDSNSSVPSENAPDGDQQPEADSGDLAEPRSLVMYWPDFWAHPDDEDAKDLEIKRVSLKVGLGAFTDSYGFERLLPSGERRSPDKTIKFELPDDLRDKVKYAFSGHPLCYAKSIHEHGAIGSNQRLAELTIERHNGEIIKVGLLTYGFSLGDGYGNFDNTFFSGFLTELVDDACY